jgi:hypothetical protein
MAQKSVTNDHLWSVKRSTLNQKGILSGVVSRPEKKLRHMSREWTATEQEQSGERDPVKVALNAEQQSSHSCSAPMLWAAPAASILDGIV